jgi:hypothetical protein
MSNQHDDNSGNLVPAGHRDLAPVASVNPLVSRGLADLGGTDSLPKPDCILGDEIEIHLSQQDNAVKIQGLAPKLQGLLNKVLNIRERIGRLRAFQATLPPTPNVAGRHLVNPADENVGSRHPFDVHLKSQYAALRRLGLILKLKELYQVPQEQPPAAAGEPNGREAQANGPNQVRDSGDQLDREIAQVQEEPTPKSGEPKK